jgi:hypothetical protein
MVDIISRLGAGYKLGQEIAQAPQRNRLQDLILQQQQQALQGQQQKAQQQQEGFDQQKVMRNIGVSLRAIQSLQSTPLEQRPQVLQGIIPQMEQLGMDASRLADADLSDQGLSSHRATLQAFAQDPKGKMTEFQKQTIEARKAALEQPTANERDLATYQRLKKESPEDAEAFGRATNLLPDAEDLSSTAEKALITAQDDYFKGAKDAREYDLLADDFARMASEIPAGSSFSFQEFLKRVAGSQDEASELRRRFSAVRLSEALKNLPPGPATDRDVAEAFKGVPPESASPQQVVSFLRGSAKLKALDNEFNLFKADYISKKNNTKGFLKAWQEKLESGDVEALSLFNQQPAQQQAPTSGVKFLGFE